MRRVTSRFSSHRVRGVSLVLEFSHGIGSKAARTYPCVSIDGLSSIAQTFFDFSLSGGGRQATEGAQQPGNAMH